VTAPLGADEFSQLMAGFGPFEAAPVIAVAVSGGPDSMALCALAHDWARARGGRVEALIVDHGLRPESTDEARRVAGWLTSLDIRCRILTWHGVKPRSNIHATARAARYGLLLDCCRGEGIVHLLLGHHQDDLAETLLLRLERHSGLDGLAAMAAIVETPDGRLLRPLLTVSQARLRATLEAHRLPSVDDPSNYDRRYGRIRIRQMMPALAEQGVTVDRLARTALAMGRARRFMDEAVARFLAGAVTPRAAGFCWLDAAAYGAAPEELSRRALTRLLLHVGGGTYPPRSERLERLHRSLADNGLGRGRTLAGCRVIPGRRGVLLCREPGAVTDDMVLQGGGELIWDRRFRVRADSGDYEYRVRRLGQDGRSDVTQAHRRHWTQSMPAAVLPSLPAIFDLDGVVAVPHLNFVRGNDGELALKGLAVEFRPAHSLSPAGFAFAGAGG
jgi:tRNA(Ile)-lysidine synthase